MQWTNKQFWLDSSWRSFRTFCQSLAGLLLAVQTSNQLSAMPEMNIPWYGYLYSSGVAALISLLQSVDRERAVESVPAETAAATPGVYVTENSAAANYQPAANSAGPGCGGDMR